MRFCTVLIALLGMGAAAISNAAERTVLPMPERAFAGHIGYTAKESKAAFPARIKPPAGAPNVLLVLTDDVGFGASSTFGGPVPTPNLDRLAAHGLRYTRFHTTAMCSSTRAALLTGRNHHAVGTGIVADLATGYPGYWSTIPKSAATVARVLQGAGYRTAFFGKHHNVPPWDSSPAGPFDLWPTHLGFDYFYGFIGGETSQFKPDLYTGITRIEPPVAPDYMLDHDLADQAIGWLHEQQAAAPERPFFIYYAPGSAHSPHQAPKDWIARFASRFDQGWDLIREQTLARQKAQGVVPQAAELTPRPEGLPAWESLSADDKRVAARLMEVFAAMLSYQDEQIGRLLAEMDRMDVSRNTLVVFIEGDNGASAEGGLEGSTNWMGTLAGRVKEDSKWRGAVLDELGGPHTYENYPAGWAWAMDTPFPWMKQVASHLGGTRNGMVLAWPGHVPDPGALRTQFHHVIDVMPTILEAAHLPAPTAVDGVRQQPLDGVSMLYTLRSAAVPDRRRTQYFEMMGNRAIYQDGWLAATTPQRSPWSPVGRGRANGNPQAYPWELYDLDADFSQAHDVAGEFPERLRKLRAAWDTEAARNKVFPLDDSVAGRVHVNPYKEDRDNYVFWGSGIRLSDDVAPPIRERSFTISADIETLAANPQGVLLAAGGRFGGWVFYLKNGIPTVESSLSQQPQDRYQVRAERAVPPGVARLRFAFKYDHEGVPYAGGWLTILLEDEVIGRGRIEHAPVIQPELTETFDVGLDSGSPVSEQYEAEGRFAGSIRKLTVDVTHAAAPLNLNRPHASP